METNPSGRCRATAKHHIQYSGGGVGVSKLGGLNQTDYNWGAKFLDSSQRRPISLCM